MDLRIVTSLVIILQLFWCIYGRDVNDFRQVSPFISYANIGENTYCSKIYTFEQHLSTNCALTCYKMKKTQSQCNGFAIVEATKQCSVSYLCNSTAMGDNTPGKIYYSTIYNNWGTTIQRRVSDAVSFNQSFEEYTFYIPDVKEGFGNKAYGNYMTVLDMVKTKTENEAHSIRFYMTFWNGTTTFAEYKHFRVIGADYLLDIGNWQGPACDAMKYQNNTKFSAPGNDNDGNMAINCAAASQSGWWFNGNNGCARANPNGKYYDESNLGQAVGWKNGIKWTCGDISENYSFKHFEIQIRKNNNNK